MAPDLSGLEFPRHVHKPSVPGEWVYLVVADAAACAKALVEGWSLTPILLPYPSESVPDSEPSPAERSETAVESDSLSSIPVKRGPGRPRKGV